MALLIEYDLQTLVLTLILIVVIALLAHAFFNLKKHPLSCFPGPRLWACSRIPYVLSVSNGTRHASIKALHDLYGPVHRKLGRIFILIDLAAWSAVRYFARGKLFGVGHRDHARIRGAVSLAIRANATGGSEENIRRYVHLLLEQLGLMANNKACDERTDQISQDEVMVDIVCWLNFTAFDIIGNLVYGGEPFGCLRRKKFKPWVELNFSWAEIVAKVSSIRFYKPLNYVLMWLLPISLVKSRQNDEFNRLGRDRVRKRILSADNNIARKEAENNKCYGKAFPSDILSHFKLSNCGEIMTMAEMEADLHLLVLAGSETITTTLSGTINYLCETPAVLKTLADEVRSAVTVQADLTIANLSKLPYLSAVLKEGLRISSPTPVSFLRVVPSEGASILGYWVPGGTIVAVNSFAATRSATNFYQPSAFLPERWLDPAATSSTSPFASDKRDASKHFGGGSRDCLGQEIAWAEMRLVPAGLVWAFDLGAVREVDWAQQKTYMVWQKKPFEIRLRRRVQV